MSSSTLITPGETSVSLQYLTTCANRDLKEDFKWQIEGEQAVLLEYRATSPLLQADLPRTHLLFLRSV